MTVFEQKSQRLKIRPADCCKDSTPETIYPIGGNHDYNRWHMRMPSSLPFFASEAIAHSEVIALVKTYLNDDPILYLYGADIAMPGCLEQRMHRDDPKPLITVNIPLMDIESIHGPTEIWPSTHDGQTEGDSRLMIARQGDIIIRDQRAQHRGTANRSKIVRPMLTLNYIGNHYFRKLPFHFASNISNRAAKRIRKLGREIDESPSSIKTELLRFGNTLSYLGFMKSGTDRDASKAIPLKLWHDLTEDAKKVLRYAQVTGKKPSSDYKSLSSVSMSIDMIRPFLAYGYGFTSGLIKGLVQKSN